MNPLLPQYFLRSGKIEGYSYLLLLFVAMPLKYVWEMPEWVRIVGMVHGVLFVIFIVLTVMLMRAKGITGKNAFFAFLLSLIPFGTFFLERLIESKEKSK